MSEAGARVNWAKVLDELHALGYSGYRLSVLLDRKWDTIKAWRNGCEPRYSDGQALLRLLESARRNP